NGGTAAKTGASTIVGTQSGKCVDDTNQSTANGNPIELYTCGGSANQLWTYTSASELRVYGKCLDASGQGTTNGTALVLYTCNGGTNQQWTLAASGQNRGVQSA